MSSFSHTPPVLSSPLQSLCILDDYTSLSARHFAHLSSRLNITTFTAPLPPSLESCIPILKPYAILCTMRERTPLPAALLRNLPNLKLVLGTGTKFESFDIDAMREAGIAFCAAPGKGRTDRKDGTSLELGQPAGRLHPAPAVQHTWALILALARGVVRDHAVVRGSNGQMGWQTSTAVGLNGLTLGIVGLGKLGAQVARIAVVAWGMRIICWSESLTQEKADERAKEVSLGPEGDCGEKVFRVVGKEELFRTADIITLHYALSERSRGIVGKKELDRMKSSAFFINTARGPLVNESALLEVLRKGGIKGAALDVFDAEPLSLDSPWRTERWGEGGRSQVVLTPHMGYVQENTLNTWYEETAENVERWLGGKELLHRRV